MHTVQAAKVILDLRLGPVRPGADCTFAPSRGWLLPARSIEASIEGTSCSISACQVSALAAKRGDAILLHSLLPSAQQSGLARSQQQAEI